MNTKYCQTNAFRLESTSDSSSDASGSINIIILVIHGQLLVSACPENFQTFHT